MSNSNQVRSEPERASIRERFLPIDTPNVADVLASLGLPDQSLTPEIHGITSQRLSGWVYTIVGQMIPFEGPDQRKLEACEGVGQNEVSVWSGNGRGVCYFGDMIALGMAKRGSVGAVIDGGLRDTRIMSELGFPAFARYQTPVQSNGRWRVTEWQVPVFMSGATSQWVVASPGDFIVADQDGAVVIPNNQVEEVLAKCEDLIQADIPIRDALQQGDSLAEVRERFGHL